MSDALEKYSSPSDTFPAPAPDPDIASLSPILTGTWNVDPAQGAHSILYWVQRDNPRAGRPMNPETDSQFAYWEFPVQLWVLGNGQPTTGTSYGSPTPIPTGSTPTSQGFRIASPPPGAIIPFGLPISLTVESVGMAPVTSVSYYINNMLIGSSAQAPYVVVFRPLTRGVVSLRAVAIYPGGSFEERASIFTVQ